MNATVLRNLWSDSRLPVIFAWRGWNSSLDFVFYDVEALTPEEYARQAHFTPEGLVLVVPPGSANETIAQLTPAEFVQSQRNLKKGAELIRTVVVTGVGSSAVGTASLARDVANYINQPVAGIVSGLGLADVLTEALGGWFVFRTRNAARDLLARTLHAVQFDDHVRDDQSHATMKEHFRRKHTDPDEFIYGSPDSTALLYILSALRPQLKLLVGHSKGNYSIENALEGLHRLCQASGEPVPRGLQIVTMGAAIWFCPEYRNVHQFVGGIDALGMLNSQLDVEFELEPHVWHSLNQVLPGHMSVAHTLELAGIPAGRSSNATLFRKAKGRKRGVGGQPKVRLQQAMVGG